MGKIKNGVSNFVTHWNKPTAGRYVSYKEIVAYSIGGMGVNFIASMFGQIAMAASCILVGSVFGLQPMHLGILTSIATVIALVFQPIKSAMIDNTKGKNGKARPYIFWLGPPCAILIIAVAFIEPTWDYMVKLSLVGGAYIILNIIYNFYFGMYGQLAQLMTPNTDERASIISVSSIVYSMAPTVTGFLLPLISDPLGGLTKINVYRLVFPIFCLVGLALGYIAYFGTKERIVVSKKYEAKVKFIDGFKKIARNRYFWITNIAGWFMFLRGATAVMLGWAYIYMLQNNAIYSVLSLVMGTASLIGMLLAPIVIKLIGKKWTTILTNGLMLVSALLLMFFSNNMPMMCVLFYLFYAASATQIISMPAMNADALDYQQWKTGDRLEGFAGNFSIIGSLIMLGTNLVIPAIYELFGLIGNYDILYVPEIRTPMFQMLCVLSAVGAVLASLPYFFWNLSEKKHRAIIEDLKRRAMEEDSTAEDSETIEELDARLKNVSVQEILNEKLKTGVITQEEFAVRMIANGFTADGEDIATNVNDDIVEVGGDAPTDNVVELGIKNAADDSIATTDNVVELGIKNAADDSIATTDDCSVDIEIEVVKEVDNEGI